MFLSLLLSVPWALNTPRMRLRLSPDRKRILGICRAQGTCLVAANVVLPRWES